jgi:mRNA interferase RelE/StbE
VYKVELRLRPQQSLNKLPAEDRTPLINAISGLEKNPRPMGIEKIRGAELWRIREGRYRLIYAINDKEKLITIV